MQTISFEDLVDSEEKIAKKQEIISFVNLFSEEEIRDFLVDLLDMFSEETLKEMYEKKISEPKYHTKVEEKVESPSNVDHPNHYQGKHECIDVMIAVFGIEAVIGFCKCNIFKYRFRSDKKNGAEDTEKAEWYETKLMSLLEEVSK